MTDAQYVEKAERIAEQTRLSEREAQLYVLKQEEDYTLRAAAEKMGVEHGTVFRKWDTIKRKIKEAEKTSRLSV